MKIVALLFAAGTIASAATLAYTDPTGAGDQTFAGSLGMDFNVNAPIFVTNLGAFDSSQDGFVGPIRVSIFDRTSQTIFGSLDTLITGTQGSVLGGDRVVTLAVPVFLPAGFQGSIVASGFSSNDPNGNSNPAGTLGGSYSSTNGGVGLISFVGTSRFGFTPGAYPTNLDGNVAKYGAGTFAFTAATAVVPEPASFVLMSFGLCAAAIYRRRRPRRT